MPITRPPTLSRYSKLHRQLSGIGPHLRTHGVLVGPGVPVAVGVLVRVGESVGVGVFVLVGVAVGVGVPAAPSRMVMR